jgi:hypothetical protein
MTIISRINRYRLRTAEQHPDRQIEHDRHDHRHERIDVLERIPREPSELQRGRVALLERRIPVRVLVRHHREQEHGRKKEEVLEFVQGGRRRRRRIPSARPM